MIFYYLLNIILIGGVIYLLYPKEPENQLKKWFWPALLLKLFCGIITGFFYKLYYGGGDTFVFQSQSLLLYEYFKVSPPAYLRLWLTGQYESETLRTAIYFLSYSNSYHLILWLSLLNIFTDGNYYLNSLYFSLFCFWGSWQLVKALIIIKPATKNAAGMAFLFLPSMVFWAAGVTKEAVYIGAISWLMAVVIRLAHKRSSLNVSVGVSILLSAYLLWKIKFYFAAVVYPLLFSYALVTWATGRFRFLESGKNSLIFLGSLLLIFSVLVAQMHPVFYLDFFYEQLMLNYQSLLVRSAGKPVLYFPDLNPTLASVIGHLPAAAFQAAVRPFIWEGNNILYRIAGTENLLTLVLLIINLVSLLIYRPRKIPVAGLVLLVYIFIVAGLIGLTTPNLGSLSRYKTAFLPFLVYLLLQNPLLNKLAGKLKSKV